MEFQSQHNPGHPSEIKVEDIFYGLKLFSQRLKKQCLGYLQIPPHRKKLFWFIVFFTVILGALLPLILPTNYEYIRSIRVAGYGFNQPLQDASTVKKELQTTIIPELITRSLTNPQWIDFLLHHWINSTRLMTVKNDNMHIIIKSYGRKSDLLWYAQTLKNLLELLKVQQQNSFTKHISMLNNQLALNQAQLQILNKLYFSQNLTYHTLKNSFSAAAQNSITTDAGFIASQMYEQVALKNVIDEQQQIFKIQNDIMQLKFNLATLRESHFASTFSAIPLRSNIFMIIAGFIIGGFLLAFFTVKTIEYAYNSKEIIVHQN